MSYEVRLAAAAARSYRKLRAAEQARVRRSLRSLAERRVGERGGKALRKLRGKDGDFFRLRVGEMRVIFDVIEEDGVILVHEIVNRRDLERWLRGR